MSQRKLGSSWWVDITHNKVRYRKKSPQNTKSGARAYEVTLRQKLAEGVSIALTSENESQSQTFQEFTEFWFKTHVLVHNKPSMAAKTRGILNNRLLPYFGRTKLSEITTLQVERYKAKYASTDLSNKTINCDLTVLRKCLGDARRWLDIHNQPEILALKVPSVGYDFLSVDDCAKLLRELSTPWYDIAYVALKTGLRIGELQALRPSDVNYEAKLLSVERSICSITRESLSTKGNSIRSVPLADDVIEIFRKRGGDSLIFEINRKAFRGQRLNEEMSRACERAGLRKVTCHVLRHTYASQLAMRGVPIAVIQRLLGHTDIKVTMRYAHLSQETINLAVHALQEPLVPRADWS